MKLLLDEMYAHAIAEQLRHRGHDVVAVSERADLRGAPDERVFAVAQEEQRTVVTDDRADYQSIDAAYRSRGDEHHGLVMTSNRRFPRSQPATIGALVRSLDQLLSEAPSTGLSSTQWLM